MIKKILVMFMKWLALNALKWVYNFIDTDDDGLLSEEEIKAFTNKIKLAIKRR